MGVFGFSVDQLMELAGLSVAQSIFQEFQESNALVVCGPGNNGGDGLVAARHLVHFGFQAEVFYPKPTQNQLYLNLIKQCENLSIPVHTTQPDLEKYDFIIDAIFGFSFSGVIRPPFDSIIRLINQLDKPVVSVDIPSGWDVEQGNVDLMGINPMMLVSLTAPKLCAQRFNGTHYVGGRFVPPAILQEFNIELPRYEGCNQFIKIN